MSAAEDIVKTFMTALEAKDFDTASSLLSDDFVFSGWTPRPLDKNQFMTLMGGLKEGIPNLAYHFHSVHNVHERLEDNRVKAAIQLSGTQTDGFVLTPLGLPPIPQMARAVSLPVEHWNYTVEHDQITRISVERVEGGGIQGVLQQLGIDVPIIQ
jgi:SnoaL-like domain